MPDADKDAAFRAQQLAAIPRWYSPYGHLCGTLGVGVLATAIAVSHLHGLRWHDFLVVPAMLIFSNFFEWWAHKNILHRPRWPFRILYEKHTPLHHRLYRWEDMAVRNVREFAFVLIPARGVLGIVVSASPLALAIGMLFGPNVGWLALVSQALYVVAYEVTHLCYHLPPSHPVQKVPLIRRLSAHHARHHDPALMNRWNFNVTLPFADWVLGTILPKDVIDARDLRRKR
ncbi:MAG TPA: sterol desaturase family protein [Candidatus Binatia bacterium]|jgi:hypothetical protein|nr:sterol desaturase family protein [Candidatus Binatia bacterium]